MSSHVPSKEHTMYKYMIVIARHGQSSCNFHNTMSGWQDTDLTEKGILQAKRVGQLLRDNGYTFDIAFTSLLKRTIKSLYYILDEMDLHWIPVHKHWRLNERHCGKRHGMKKDGAAWSLYYDVVPPPLETSDKLWNHFIEDKKFKGLAKNAIPTSESSKDAFERLKPFWYDEIVPLAKAEKKILVVAHSNIMKGLIKHLNGIADVDFGSIGVIKQGSPLVLQFDDHMNLVNQFYIE